MVMNIDIDCPDFVIESHKKSHNYLVQYQKFWNVTWKSRGPIEGQYEKANVL